MSQETDNFEIKYSMTTTFHQMSDTQDNIE